MGSLDRPWVRPSAVAPSARSRAAACGSERPSYQAIAGWVGRSSASRSTPDSPTLAAAAPTMRPRPATASTQSRMASAVARHNASGS